MEEENFYMKEFLKEFNEEIRSPTSDDFANTRIVSYSLDPEDIPGQVIDWILNYLDNRKCPYPLALSIAKDIAHQVSASFAEIVCNATEEELEKSSNAATLYAEAIGKLPAICQSFLDQANLDSICSIKYTTSVFAIKNKRRKMEDRHVIHHDLNALLDLKDAPQQSYYAVFDGHSGIDAASYASSQLHVNIAKHPDFLTDTPKAIMEGFQITDLNFLNKCNKGNIKSGCTAVCALIRENTLYLSWLGDSQAVLVKGGVPLNLTNPHKPDREDERSRIENLGGHVSNMGVLRVNGLLAITRAIGDPDQKRFICSEPEMQVINLDGTEDFLILACDGLWDGLSPEDVTTLSYRYLVDNSAGEPLDSIAAKLVHQAKLQGSEDNITAIVVFLRDANTIRENSANFMLNSFPVKSENFLSMNGNTESPSSDIPFVKPTVLELNSASSKKLKNTANVMSSAGFGSASYSYQYVENPMEASFQNSDSSIEINQNAFLSHQTVTSCFAPEATALSELPTPPIDDILASQEFENLYATNLYKEFNSIQASQSSQSTEVIDTTDLNVNIPDVDSTALQPCDVSNVDNMSLLDTEISMDTNQTAAISPDEAVGIASTVVSTAIETAVKCLSDETPDSTQIQSPIKLNPYAKPFVMKSFFSTEESAMQSDISSEVDILMVVDDAFQKPLAETSTKSITDNVVLDHLSDDNLPVSSNITIEQCIVGSQAFNNDSLENPDQSNLISDNKSVKGDLSQSILGNISCEQSAFDDTNQPVTNIVTAENTIQDNILSLPSTDVKISTGQCTIDSASDKILEQINSQPVAGIESSDQVLLCNVTGEEILNKSSNIMDSITPQSVVSPETVSNPVPENLNDDMVKIINQELVSEASTLEDISSSLSHEIENLNLNSGSNLFTESITGTVEQLSTLKDTNLDVAIASSITTEAEIHEQEPISDGTDKCIEKSNITDYNQNNELVKCAVEFASENISEISSEKESKAGVIEKSKIPESSVLLESLTKESLSLIDINNELVSTVTEVPSDPSVEDSHVEPVAVDLKTLPEGIPEAEGVTEDVDSDSEKDGGWSYMKGNTVSGSKSKPREKVSKSLKSNELKLTASKLKKDVSKSNLDSKSKFKTTVQDKTKSASIADKTKSISDKTKSAPVSEKPKTAVLTKTTPSSGIKKTLNEKKPDVKSGGMKSYTLTSTRITSDKTSRISTMSVKKETTETLTKMPISKPTRPTTLLRTTPSASKLASTTTDKSTSSSKVSVKSTTSMTMKPKVKTTVSENATNVKNSTTTSTLSKGLPSVQSKPGVSSVRNAPVRPSTSVPSRTTTVVKSASLQKSASSESKPKQLISTAPRKPIPSTLKKPDVKEVKDTVNKQISAKKSNVTTRVESSTLASRRVASGNNKSTLSKVSSNSAKPELAKKDMPKVPASKSTTKNASSKISQVASMSKEDKTVQNKADQTKNELNINIEQKSTTEIVQITEEKFILETSDKEVIAGENVENLVENQHILENGSLFNSMTPVEVSAIPVEAPIAECASESL